ncbi:uncharacterized protein FYW49_002813 [Xenentodon cancila]
MPPLFVRRPLRHVTQDAGNDGAQLSPAPWLRFYATLAAGRYVSREPFPGSVDISRLKGGKRPSGNAHGGEIRRKGETWSFTSQGSKNTGSSSHGGYPKQPGQNNQGGYPSQSGGTGNQGSYPRQQGGGFYNQYPGRGSPYGAGYGGYPGGYINQNPNNRILSPHYGGSFGYGGYGSRGGSPFSQSVQGMGMYPNAKSKGFGRTAVMAAAGGAMAGMALGYGLGRFPRPHFHFHSPQEEYYYNHYMYRKYGSQSSDTSDNRRQHRYMPAPQTYDSYMDSCMKRTDLFPADSQRPGKKSAASTEATKTNVVASASDNNTERNMTNTNSSAGANPLSPSPSPPHASSQPEVASVPPDSRDISTAEDDDTVSIVEIGYPALIEQVKVRRCLELYMTYSAKNTMKQTGGAQGLNAGFQGVLAAVLSTLLMAVNSNILMPLH